MSGEQAKAANKRITKAQAELDGLVEDEKRLEVLERRERWEAGALNVQERQELARLSDALRADAGVVLDIGMIEVGPLSGKVQAGERSCPASTSMLTPRSAPRATWPTRP